MARPCDATQMLKLSRVFGLTCDVFGVSRDALMFLRLMFRSSSSLAAENLFLRKQLALYVERRQKPRRATDSIRVTLARLSELFDWRDVLTVVKPRYIDPLASKRLSIVLEVE